MPAMNATGSKAAIPLPPPETILANCRIALDEDLGHGDLTAALIPIDQRSKATLLSREPAVICGCAWVDATFASVDPEVRIHWLIRDGETVAAGHRLCTLHGRARSILSAERSALNFLQTLSATATLTRRYADAIAHTQTRLLDTRKTIPGLRQAQKYAVRCGGGENHRMGLYDAILIKENHIIAAGSIEQAVKYARAREDRVLVVVEVENLQELELACTAEADRALVDNFNLAALREAVRINAGRLQLEASGNITLDNIAETAETGVDFISVGALTKNIRAIDFSLRFCAD